MNVLAELRFGQAGLLPVRSHASRRARTVSVAFLSSSSVFNLDHVSLVSLMSDTGVTVFGRSLLHRAADVTDGAAKTVLFFFTFVTCLQI